MTSPRPTGVRPLGPHLRLSPLANLPGGGPRKQVRPWRQAPTRRERPAVLPQDTLRCAPPRLSPRQHIDTGRGRWRTKRESPIAQRQNHGAPKVIRWEDAYRKKAQCHESPGGNLCLMHKTVIEGGTSRPVSMKC